jgi:X-X-X-Leu-X-X-Gly heptad repeat protein
VYIVILLAAAAILGGVVVVAMGRGGEMALFDRDLPVRAIRLETPGDVVTLRLPFGLIGYQTRAAGEALIAAANLLARRDAEIAELRREIWRLGGDGQMVVADESAESALEFSASGYAAPGCEVPGYTAPGYAVPGYGVPGYAHEEVGAVNYTSASLAAWYDSIAQPGAAELSDGAAELSDGAAEASDGAAEASARASEPSAGAAEASAGGPPPGASEQGQDELSRLDKTSQQEQDGQL